MKRTDLIALVKRVEGMKLPPGYNAEAVAQLAEFARQIAQAQPVGWVSSHDSKRPLYHLPLED